MYENRCDGGGMDLWILFENVGGCGGMVDIEQIFMAKYRFVFIVKTVL